MDIDSKDVNMTIPVPAGYRELQSSVPMILESAKAFLCETPEDYQFGSDEIKGIKKRRDTLEEMRKSATRPLDAVKATIMGWFKPPIALLDESESLVKRQLLAYQDKAERDRAEAQAKIDEQARREREKLEAQARKAEEQGKTEKAEALQQRAQTAVVPTVVAAVPKVAGTHTMRTWRAECDDVIALCRAIADGKVAPIAVDPNMKFLNAQARSLAEHFAIPGCRAIEEKTLVSRSK